MGTMTFQINDASTGGNNPAVWVTITENADGTLAFQISQQGGIVGDLRGLFFDVADESLLKSLVVKANSSDIRIGDDSVRDLGDGANMNGLTGSDGGYDVGIEIGTSGIGKDDVRSYSFTLDSTSRDLTLHDFSNVNFAVRLTSVGILGGARADSSKLMENTSVAIDVQNAVASTTENESTHGTLLGNLLLPGSIAVSSWSGGNIGASANLVSNADIIGTLRVNQDGSYLLDGSLGDVLSAGESISFTYDYSARNQDEATSWSTDSAQFTVTINGVNDGPDARDDAGGTVTEDTILAGSVAANDSDVDRLDTHTWSLVDGSFDGLGNLSFNADGSWSYDASGAYDSLMTGDQIELSFSYLMTDNHGASDMGTVRFTVEGVGSVEPPSPPPPADIFPAMLQNISNVVLYLDDGNSATDLLKVKLQPEGLQLNDVDLLNIYQFLNDHGSALGGNTQLVGISIHAGQEYPNLAGTDMTAQGEGAFYFLLDGEAPTVEAIGTRIDNRWSADWTNDDIPLTQEALDAGLSYTLLAQQAQIVFSEFDPVAGIWLV